MIIAHDKIWHEHVIHRVWAGKLFRDSAMSMLTKTDLAIKIVETIYSTAAKAFVLTDAA